MHLVYRNRLNHPGLLCLTSAGAGFHFGGAVTSLPYFYTHHNVFVCKAALSDQHSQAAFGLSEFLKLESTDIFLFTIFLKTKVVVVRIINRAEETPWFTSTTTSLTLLLAWELL